MSTRLPDVRLQDQLDLDSMDLNFLIGTTSN
jgi:hypothetical protein